MKASDIGECIPRRLLALGIASCVIWGQPASAQELSAPQWKQLIVETIHMYEVREYLPPVSFTLQDASLPVKPRSPEDAIVLRVRAMMRGDYEAFLRTWNEDAQKLMRERDRAANRDAASWAEAWKPLKGGKGLLVSRVNYGKYVFVRYRIDVADGAAPFESSVAFAPSGDGWLGTHELIRDPVFNNWESGKTRVQTVAEIAVRK